MKLAAFVSVATSSVAASVNIDDGSIPSEARFAAWNEAHGKNFVVGSDEHRGWLLNDAIIQESNSKDLSYTLGHNEYSYLSQGDFAAMLTMEMPKSLLRKNEKNVEWSLADPEVVAAAPDSLDWTTKGAVTSVKNQKQCGSCWAFSTTGSVEGAFQIAGNPLTSLSEQELVSCDKLDNGCNGGLMDTAFEYVEKHGLCTESSYPYDSGSGERHACQKTCSPAVKVESFKDVPKRDEDALKAAVAKGPVSIAIEADKSVFQLYKSGVLDSKACGTRLDHGVLAVGYGTEAGKDYWKVKNSWGETWGMDGYVLLGRGNNICGIAEQPSYPTGAEPASAETVAVGKEAQLTITDCSPPGSNAKNVKFSFSPNPAIVGQPVTVSGTADYTVGDSAPTYTMKASYGSIRLVDHTDTLCKDTSVSLPLGIGKVNVSEITSGCPLKPGNVGISAQMPIANLPGTIKATFQTTSSSGNNDLCLNIEVKV